MDDIGHVKDDNGVLLDVLVGDLDGNGEICEDILSVDDRFGHDAILGVSWNYVSPGHG